MRGGVNPYRTGNVVRLLTYFCTYVNGIFTWRFLVPDTRLVR